MAIPTPSRSDSTETETETETETATFPSRLEDFEDYRGVIDTLRYIKKVCLTHGVGVDEDGYPRFKDAEDDSPVARDGLFYYRTKEEMKEDFQDRRADGDLTEDQNLPAYKDEYPEPDHDYTEVTAENAADYGLDPETFEDGEKIQVPDEYTPETDDDGALKVWDNPSDTDYTKADVLEALNGVKGIGDAKAGKSLNALQDAGILPDDL